MNWLRELLHGMFCRSSSEPTQPQVGDPKVEAAHLREKDDAARSRTSRESAD
jgi:hypothetical protein